MTEIKTISEKDRAEYLRLLIKQDEALLGLQGARNETDVFMVRVRKQYSIARAPFIIDPETGVVSDAPQKQPGDS